MGQQQALGAGSRVTAGARVLILGAGFAGLATAYWMNRLGYRVTIVEISESLRRGGTPVDIKKGTIDIVRRMGLLDAIRARSLPPRKVEIKNADDRTEALLPARTIIHGSPDEQHEIERDDLLDMMFGAVSVNTEIIFGRSVVDLENQPDRVTARFADGSSRDFALAFGCDGVRSKTRQMIFGDKNDCTHFLERYAYLKVVDKVLIDRDTTQIYSVPGLTVMLNGYQDKTDIALGFHSKHEIAYDHRDKARQRHLVRERFEGLGWRTPELLKEVDADGDFYFDRICQICMPSWSRGRVALVGDAGYCPSPFAGMGGSMAIVGAAALADAFQEHDGDFDAAFRGYDASLRPFVEEIQSGAVSFGMAMFAPATEAALIERDRMLSEMAQPTTAG